MTTNTHSLFLLSAVLVRIESGGVSYLTTNDIKKYNIQMVVSSSSSLLSSASNGVKHRLGGLVLIGQTPKSVSGRGFSLTLLPGVAQV